MDNGALYSTDRCIDTQKETCSVCKQTKSSSEFYRDRSRTTGLTRRCKACHKSALVSVGVRRRVMRGIRDIAKKYEVSNSRAVEMLVLDALQDEEMDTSDWTARGGEEASDGTC